MNDPFLWSAIGGEGGAIDLAEKEAASPIYVIGKRIDTAVAKDWAGHVIFDISDWTIAKNDAFVKQIIEQRAPVYIGSPQTQATLFDVVNGRATVFARELQQFKQAGYRQVGDYMFPPVKP